MCVNNIEDGACRGRRINKLISMANKVCGAGLNRAC
jgi:hypothetical protein